MTSQQTLGGATSRVSAASRSAEQRSDLCRRPASLRAAPPRTHAPAGQALSGRVAAACPGHPHGGPGAQQCGWLCG